MGFQLKVASLRPKTANKNLNAVVHNKLNGLAV